MWTRAQLLSLQAGAERGLNPSGLARAACHTEAECDVARWHMLGRTPVQAVLARLNGDPVRRVA